MNQIIDKTKKELTEWKDIKTFSFDIFDTLVFRNVVIPDRVFWYMYRKKPSAFPSFTTIGDWVNSRRCAEQEARRISKETYGHEEVSLEKIYNCLPTAYSNLNELIQLEYESECEIAVLNMEILELIHYLHNVHKKNILLISDMHLNSKQMEELLRKCGMDLSMIEKIYISSEFKASKRSGKLFQIVLEEQKLKPTELAHFGDNMLSDIVMAKQLGIHVNYYSFMAERQFRYPFLLWEQEFYGSPLCEELYLIRMLTERYNSGTNEEERFFFMLGAMIMGPFFTYAIEWVIDTALKEGISQIRPFMREGKFLAKMLNVANEEYGLGLSVEPLYISRLAAYSARFSEITIKELSALMAGANVTPRDVFHILQIEEFLVDFKQYQLIPFSELKALVNSHGENVYELIFDFLSSHNMLKVIRQRHYGKKTLFTNYLIEMGLNKPSITLDLGWNGSTMNAVYQAIHEAEPNTRLLQLLLCSTKNVVKNSTDGCVIKGFVGNYGGLQGKFNKIFIPIFEMFCLCEEGPTIGYEYDAGKIIPIIGENIYSSEWLSRITNVQQGIMAFQKIFLKMSKPKKIKPNLKAQGIQALSMIERLFSYPLFQEAEYLCSAKLDQNIGIENRVIPILENDFIQKYQDLGAEKFYKNSLKRQRSITWYQALPTLNSPLGYLKMHYLQSAQYGKLSSLLLVEHAVKMTGNSGIMVVIDSQTAEVDLIMTHFNAMNMLEKIVGVISINTYMYNIVYNGFSVLPIHTKLDADIYFIPTKEKTSYDLLRNQIISEKGTQIKIVGYFENDFEVFNDE